MRSSQIRSVFVLVFIFSMLIFSPAGVAQGNEAKDIEFALVGRAAGAVRTVAVSGAHAYVGVGYKLLVFEVHDPVHPQLIAESPALAAQVEGIAVSGQYAYVAAGKAGLKIFNVATPSAPVLVGSLKTHGAAQDVTSVGSHAFIAAGAAGLRVIDVSNAAAPVEIGHYDNANYEILRVAVPNNRAYVTTRPSGLHILDVTHPTAPIEIGSLVLGGSAAGIDVHLPYAYIAAGAGGLRIVDVSNPQDPAEIGASTKQAPEDAYDVVVSNDYAYVADRTVSDGDEQHVPGGLRIVNISTPQNPLAIGKIKGSAWSVDVKRGHVYLADFDAERGDVASFDVIDVMNPAAAKRIASFSIPVRIDHPIVANNSTLYTIDNRLRQFDLTDPHQPRLGWSLALQGDTYFRGQLTGLALNGSLALVGGGTAGLHIVDLSDPASPHLITTVPVEAYDVATNRNLVFVSELYGGIRIVNVANPDNPRVVGTITGNWSVSDMQAIGDYFYVANYAYPAPSALLIYSIHDPRMPILLGSFDLKQESARHVEVAGQYAYLGVGTDNPSLMIINISTPSLPKKVGEFAVSPAYISDMTLSGSTIYLTLPAIPRGGLRAIDVSDPATPHLNGEYQMSRAFANAVTVLPGQAVALGSSEGLLVLEVATP
jgi:hypothetical protein